MTGEQPQRSALVAVTDRAVLQQPVQRIPRGYAGMPSVQERQRFADVVSCSIGVVVCSLDDVIYMLGQTTYCRGRDVGRQLGDVPKGL